jgi:hypothetical protein
MDSFFIAVLLVAACAAAAVQVARWLAERPVDDYDLPPIIIPMMDGFTSVATARASNEERPAAPSNEELSPVQELGLVEESSAVEELSVVEESSSVEELSPVPNAESPAATAGDAPQPLEIRSAPPAVYGRIEDRAGASTSAVPAVAAETVQFRRPVDDALQLLPGRLEVLSGAPQTQEIRFVRIPGEPPELILGRDPGHSRRHIALRSNTVSRRHARLALAEDGWRVTNLSQTNPLVVNDEVLPALQGERTLADGDRIELGEVVLRFCAH